MDNPQSTQRRAWLSAERGALALMLLLTASIGWLWWDRRGSWRDQPATPTSQPGSHYLRQVDPNTANWQTLACVPGIGETRARAIINYREQWVRRRGCPAFTQPDDLIYDKKAGRGIKGFGKKIVEQLEPHLVFTQPDE